MVNKLELLEKEGFKYKPILFIDADGTLREPIQKESPFIKDYTDIKLKEGVRDKLLEYKDSHIIVIISNQGGIAHGFKTEADIEKEFDITCNLLNNNLIDPLIDRELVFYCPFEKNGKVVPFNNDSTLRKPNVGLATLAEFYLMAKKYICIDWDNSFMVGDRAEDLGFADNLNIKFQHIDEFLKEK